jgi:hypothetical protein
LLLHTFAQAALACLIVQLLHVGSWERSREVALALAAMAVAERGSLAPALVRAVMRDALSQIDRVLRAANLRRSLLDDGSRCPWPTTGRAACVRAWATYRVPPRAFAWWSTVAPAAAEAWLGDVATTALVRYWATARAGQRPGALAADLVRRGVVAPGDVAEP